MDDPVQDTLMDIYSRRKRSQIMARVASQDTAPELAVRSLIHNMGFRFRLNRKDLSGKPDIVLPRLGKAIFVHGCFWHQHPNCPKARRPQTNSRFWNDKLDANVARDERSLRKLRELGWQTLVVWECEARNRIQMSETLERFLKGSSYN